MTVLVSKEAVWDDDAVAKALDCAAYWVKDLPFVKSLSGNWKFFLASSPSDAPSEFYDSKFQDSSWNTIPGNIFALCCCNNEFVLCKVWSVSLYGQTMRPCH